MNSRRYAGLKSSLALMASVKMRYLNALSGLLLHFLLILLAYAPLFVRCMNTRLYEIYPVIILFLFLSLNEMLLAITPPSVMVLPVCSFIFSIIIGLLITQIYPWIYPFMILGLFVFVLGLILQFLITLI